MYMYVLPWIILVTLTFGDPSHFSYGMYYALSDYIAELPHLNCYHYGSLDKQLFLALHRPNPKR